MKMVLRCTKGTLRQVGIENAVFHVATNTQDLVIRWHARWHALPDFAEMCVRNATIRERTHDALLGVIGDELEIVNGITRDAFINDGSSIHVIDHATFLLKQADGGALARMYNNYTWLRDFRTVLLPDSIKGSESLVRFSHLPKMTVMRGE